MKNLKVSIITVCYNSAKTIEQTILSVINQSYTNIEYIIIDGGSTDETISIIRKYEKKISYWVSEADQGIYDAMNKGIHIATGEIIGIINSDDWYSDNIFDLVVKKFYNNNIDVLYGNIFAVFREYNFYKKCESSSSIEALNWFMALYHPSVFIRKNVYEKYGTFNCKYRITADYELLLRLYKNHCNFCYLNEEIANFGMGGISNLGRCWRTVIEERNVSLEYLKKNPANRKMLVYAEKLKHHNDLARKVMRDVFFKKRIKKNGFVKNIIQYLDRFILKSHREIVIFGAGENGNDCYIWLRDLYDDAMPLRCFIDNDKDKVNKLIDGYEIKNTDIISTEQNSIFVIIASEKHFMSMEKQLLKMNFIKGKDWLRFDELRLYVYQIYLDLTITR